MTWIGKAIPMVAAVTFAHSAWAQEMPPGIREVWEMEEAFWRYVQAGDVEKFVGLWDDESVTWPCESQESVRKAEVGTWVRDIRDNGWRIAYELNPMAVQRFDDLAVVQYAAAFTYHLEDGETRYDGVRWKFTHTWRKLGSTWWIVGGMCGRLLPEGDGPGP